MIHLETSELSYSSRLHLILLHAACSSHFLTFIDLLYILKSAVVKGFRGTSLHTHNLCDAYSPKCLILCEQTGHDQQTVSLLQHLQSKQSRNVHASRQTAQVTGFFFLFCVRNNSSRRNIGLKAYGDNQGE